MYPARKSLFAMIRDNFNKNLRVYYGTHLETYATPSTIAWFRRIYTSLRHVANSEAHTLICAGGCVRSAWHAAPEGQQGSMHSKCTVRAGATQLDHST